MCLTEILNYLNPNTYMEDVDLSLIRLACLAERALTLSLTGWPEIS